MAYEMGDMRVSSRPLMSGAVRVEINGGDLDGRFFTNLVIDVSPDDLLGIIAELELYAPKGDK